MVIDKASRCSFSGGYCAADKQKAVDDRILHKIVFGINNTEARQKLFEEEELTLTKARKIVEEKERIQDTERDFMSGATSVNAVRKENGTFHTYNNNSSNTNNEHHSEKAVSKCQRCGKSH